MNLAASTVLSDGVNCIIEEFIALSCLDEKVDRFSMGIVGSIENDRNSMPVNVFDKYKEIVGALFDSSVLKKNVRAVILGGYDDHKIGEMVNFLKHPQIVLMNQEEESSKAPSAIQNMQSFFASLEESPPTDKRKALIEGIDGVKRSSSFVIDMQVELFQAITWGMRGLSAEDQKITEEQLKKLVLDMKVQIGKHIKQQVWMGMLYAYKGLSDRELEDYISLHNTAEGVATTEFVQSVYSDVHKQGVGRLQCSLNAEFD